MRNGRRSCAHAGCCSSWPRNLRRDLAQAGKQAHVFHGTVLPPGASSSTACGHAGNLPGGCGPNSHGPGVRCPPAPGPFSSGLKLGRESVADVVVEGRPDMAVIAKQTKQHPHRQPRPPRSARPRRGAATTGKHGPKAQEVPHESTDRGADITFGFISEFACFRLCHWPFSGHSRGSCRNSPEVEDFLARSAFARTV